MPRGQSVTENMFIIGLVALVGISSLAVLGLQLNNQFRNMISANTQGQSTVVAETIALTALPENAGKLPPPKSNEESVCFNSGFCLNIPVMAGGKVEAMGGIGGEQTRQYASVLSQLAAQVEAEFGKDNPLTVMLTSLSLKGHALGNWEDNHLSDQKNWTKVNGAKYGEGRPGGDRFKGDSVNKVKSAIKSLQTQLMSFNAERENVTAYLQDHPQILQKKPEISGLITSQAQEITNIAQNLQTYTIKTLPSGNYTLTRPSNSAEIVHQNANTICHGGGERSKCSYIKTPEGEWQPVSSIKASPNTSEATAMDFQKETH